MLKLQCNPVALRQDLINLARTFGWSGDYSEIAQFVMWVGDEIGLPISSLELEPLETEYTKGLFLGSLEEASERDPQYFDVWPKESGLPFHIFVTDKTLGRSVAPYFLAPPQGLVNEPIFKLTDYSVIPIEGRLLIEEPVDLYLLHFRRNNSKVLLALWNGDIDIVEFKQQLNSEPYTLSC